MFIRIIGLSMAAVIFFLTNAFGGDFTINSDDTATDNATGLMWQRRDDDVGRTLQQALEYCNALSLAGYDDWRLPNVKELESIVEITNYNPAIDTAIFIDANSTVYWTSTSWPVDPAYVWLVNFMHGRVNSESNSKNFSIFVRCVR